ncbi:hypothetical protein G7046_g3527 [Stylonectria norvegica]|nr:hypothetical protein G7046_g3527 [Stylonectria norvegica]
MMATNGSTQPTCQNCSTSTTPLWRRDEFGSVLCNACGLFLKLHGRPRPISLKTDVIKSRNRVKTMRPDLAPKKKVMIMTPAPELCAVWLTLSVQQQQQQQGQLFGVATDANGVDMHQNNAAVQAARRASQKSNGHNDGSDSPISRTGTPSMYNHIPSFMVDDPYQQSGASGFNGSGVSEGQAPSPMNGDRNHEAPQTHEQLIAFNSSLKTRVSELEVINELFRGRLSQLEQQEAAARRGQEVAGVEQSQLRSQLDASQESEAHMRGQLEDSHRRENSLKRRLDDLELELKEAKESLEAELERPAKKPRLAEVAEVAEEAVKSEEAVKPEQVSEPAPAA